MIDWKRSSAAISQEGGSNHCLDPKNLAPQMPQRIDAHNYTKKEMLSRLDKLENAMAKHKALLLGTSYSAMPLLQTLKTYNLHITACGKTSTQTILRHADDVLNVDYKDKEILLNYVE